MSDYTKSYNGAAKDAAESVIYGADFDTEFQAIETAIATKANKKIPVAAGNVATLSASGDLQDGAVTSTELAILDGATVTTAELNILDGVTATTAEINVLDGIPGTLTATELGYVDGVTSAIQTQLDAKVDSPVITADIQDGAITDAKVSSVSTGSTTINTFIDSNIFSLATADNTYTVDTTKYLRGVTPLTFTALRTGSVSVTADMCEGGGGTAQIKFYVNRTLSLTLSSTSNFPTFATQTGTLSFSAGDMIEISVEAPSSTCYYKDFYFKASTSVVAIV